MATAPAVPAAPPSHSTQLSGLRKAAILILSVGEDAAAELFKLLKPEEIEEITREISLMGVVQAKDSEAVIEEFYSMSMARSYISEGGVEYAKALLVKALGPDEARRIIDRIMKMLHSSEGFYSLDTVDPQQLSKFVQNEHPQTVALIMAQLDATKAAELLTALPENLRAGVAQRMASLKDISPDVVERVSAFIAKKLKAIGGAAGREAAGGARAVAEMLNRMDRSTSRGVLEKIEQENPQLAIGIRDLMFVFDDIMLIDDAGIREILQRAEKKTLTLALKGTSPELQQQFFKNMSQRAVDIMKEEIEVLGAVKIREVEKSQQEIVALVTKLEQEGVIAIGGGGDEYVT